MEQNVKYLQIGLCKNGEAFTRGGDPFRGLNTRILAVRSPCYMWVKELYTKKDVFKEKRSIKRKTRR
jgi:hypothetical protein